MALQSSWGVLDQSSGTPGDLLNNFHYDNESDAQDYCDNFGNGNYATSELTEQSNPNTGGVAPSDGAYAVIEDDGVGDEEIAVLRDTEAAANSYVSIFGGGRTLRVHYVE